VEGIKRVWKYGKYFCHQMKSMKFRSSNVDREIDKVEGSIHNLKTTQPLQIARETCIAQLSNTTQYF